MVSSRKTGANASGSTGFHVADSGDGVGWYVGLGTTFCWFFGNSWLSGNGWLFGNGWLSLSTDFVLSSYFWVFSAGAGCWVADGSSTIFSRRAAFPRAPPGAPLTPLRAPETT